MTGLTTQSLRYGISAVLTVLERRHDELTVLDGKLGDGDLGITLLKAFRALEGIKDTLPLDLGAAFMACATRVSEVSSSSFGNLLVMSLTVASKRYKGSQEAHWSDMAGLVQQAMDTMSQRGKANLGDKTVLDALAGIVEVAEGLSDPDAILEQAMQAVSSVLDEFRDRPSRIGRARIFAERSIGLDDPGMVAAQIMLAGLAQV
ncbi:dihydroxyacetone kinase subunit L [Novosphingobium mathurense]|uniref:Dihydroxyacetone kinase, C-terminal domain n=1 Tax=Novosphingobium mathurense TaxID=428990 RepID=A0A1U6IM10_9SPHN|nr:dihydroxyacetone kinase subunit L [Novosphingobium mathurense]SLK09017.1 dihydroxyacetone kinase, C-terminal domain [Novosphingobium mathurense]